MPHVPTKWRFLGWWIINYTGSKHWWVERFSVHDHCSLSAENTNKAGLPFVACPVAFSVMLSWTGVNSKSAQNFCMWHWQEDGQQGCAFIRTAQNTQQPQKKPFSNLACRLLTRERDFFNWDELAAVWCVRAGLWWCQPLALPEEPARCWALGWAGRAPWERGVLTSQPRGWQLLLLGIVTGKHWIEKSNVCLNHQCMGRQGAWAQLRGFLFKCKGSSFGHHPGAGDALGFVSWESPQRQVHPWCNSRTVMVSELFMFISHCLGCLIWVICVVQSLL